MARTPLTSTYSPHSDENDDFVGLHYGPMGPDEPEIGQPVAFEPDGRFDENLAEILAEEVLKDIGRKCVEAYEEDYATREKAEEAFQEGLKTIGLEEEGIDDGPFPGASTATYPGLIVAMVQFWARALTELMPSEGPIKAKIHGQKTQGKADRASRVQHYMNYQVMTEDESYLDAKSRLFFALPFHASMFTFTYWDPLTDQLRGRKLTPLQVIVNARADTLEDAPRVTIKDKTDPNDVLRKQKMGEWRDCELGPVDQEENTSSEDAIQELDKREESDAADDDRRLILTQFTDLDIPGHQHTDDAGAVTGIKLPYMVIIDHQSEQVLSITRNWREDDPLQRKREYLTHYQFLPGFGFYGLGLIECIGRLGNAANGALRLILDGAASASLGGGFLSDNGSTIDDRIVREPGVWKRIRGTYDELRKAFFEPPVKDPSPQLFNILELIIESMRSFASSTEVMTGEANNNAPVGTTIALIEQAQTVHSAIYRMLHVASAREYRIRYELNAEYIPKDGYPYDIDADDDGHPDDPYRIFKADFAPGVSVEPVSDPNIASRQQRIAMQQAVRQMALETPQDFDFRKINREMLRILRVPDPDSYFQGGQDPTPLDPITENQHALLGQPFKAFPEQDHASHIAVHMSFMQNPGYGGHPEVAEQIALQMRAHIAEHLAFQYAAQAAALGVPALPAAVGPEDKEDERPQIPPELQAIISAQAAAQAGQLAQVPGLPPAEPAADPEGAKLRHEEEKHQQGLRHKEQEHSQKLRQSLDDATLSREERSQKALDEQADADLKRDLAKAQALKDGLAQET